MPRSAEDLRLLGGCSATARPLLDRCSTVVSGQYLGVRRTPVPSVT
jgi:hypothetical protein